MKKFALHNYGGKPVAYYLVEGEFIAKQAVSTSSAPSHHIAILDVSGSMWGELDSVKSVLEKVFTAEEFNDPNQKVSLISYSSNGDCIVHFEKVTVEEVLAPNSPHLKEIRNLRTRGLTAISQALFAAEKIIDDSETTCISLHTDGYANHPSPFQEARSVVAAIEALSKHPNVFCNTVAYRSWCDFQMLDAIANRLSGTCVRVQNAKQVYQALHSTQAMLAGSMSPVFDADIGKADFITFVSFSAKKVLGGTESLNVRGLSSTDDGMFFRYQEVDEATYNSSDAGAVGITPILAYCRVQLALGNLNAAKYAMISTRATTLISEHARAMVATEIAAMADGVEKFMFNGLTMMYSSEYGLGDTGPSILSVMAVLSKYTSSLRLNVEDLLKGYQRRGLKRVAGKRDDDGVLVPPKYQLQSDADMTAVEVIDVVISKTGATVNITTVRDAHLVGDDDKVIKEVAGVKLDLKNIRAYTLVGDGVVNVKVLSIRTSDKRCFRALHRIGAVTGTFDPTAQYDLNLGQMPLVDYDQGFDTVPAGTFTEYVKLSIFHKILGALTKGESASLTKEQIVALKEYNLSSSLYFSPPSTTPYTDLTDALKAGEVDTRVGYQIRVGSPDILHVGKVKSGNALLQRRFTLTVGNNTVKKPTLNMWWENDNTWAIKKLTKRTKLDGVDALAYPIYEGFLELGDGDDKDKDLREVLHLAGADEDEFFAALQGGMDRDESVQLFRDIYWKVQAAISKIDTDVISPLAFYVGATGLVPDSMVSKAMNAEQLIKAFPGTKLGKAEKEGTYYEIAPKVLLGIFTKAEHFSTARGLKVAQDL